MNVTAILKDKGSSVATCRPDVSLAAVSQMLADKKIGAVVVIGERGDVAGIASERDVIRAIARHGEVCLTEAVERHMTRDVVKCSRADTIEQLMSLMTQRRIRHLPVVEDGALVGIVSIGDVVKLHIAEVELEASALRDYIVHS